MSKIRELRLIEVAPDASSRVRVPAMFIAVGVCSFVAAAVVIGAWSSTIVTRRGFDTPLAIATTHLLALGFASSVAVGVLYHLAPRTFGSPLPSPRLGVLVWCCFSTSLVMFVVSLATATNALSAIAGPLLALGIIGFLLQMANVVRNGKRRSLTCTFMVVSLIAFLLVAVMGSLLAMSLQLGFVKDVNPVLGAKIILAVGGWIAFLVVGASYQIIPMFTLSRAKQRFGSATFWLMLCGLIAAPITLLFQAPAPLRVISMIPYAIGLFLYLVDVLRMMHNRLRPNITPVSVGHTVGAIFLAIDALCAFPALCGLLPWPQIAVCGALLGWVPCFIVASAFRIIPALLWEARGVGNRPRVPVELPPLVGWIAVMCAIPIWPAATLAFTTQSPMFGVIAASLALVTSGSLAGSVVLSVRSGSGGMAHPARSAS